MSKSLDEQALVIPSGLQIVAEGEAFNIGNKGDVVLRGQVGFSLRRLFSEEGSVTLESTEPLTLSRVEAPHGDIRIKGALTIQTLVAKRVALLGGNLNVRQLVASEEVYLSGESLQADMIMAPRVDIDARLKGRATVLESKNDIGPNMLKGGFRLDEYLEIFPTGQALLDQYPEVKAHLEGWAEVVAPAESSLLKELTPPAPAPAPAPAPRPAESARARRAEQNAQPIEISSAELAGDSISIVPNSPVTYDEDERTDARRELPESRRLEGEALYQRLSDSFLKIISHYSDVRLPPPLSTLEGLIEERRFDAIKKDLTKLWTELLQFHKREGVHVANAVTQNIQEMRKLVSDL